jgi:aryl-alcohol dehydrogenase-like predicted oxidoreductase
MQQRRIGDRQVSAIGLGGMPMSVEGRPDRERSIATIHAALDAGVTLIDTADAYHLGADDAGQDETGHNEALVAEALRSWGGGTDDVLVATKGGHQRQADGTWTLDGRPEHIREAARASAARLGVEAIDLYQYHRPDPEVPYEETLGAFAELLQDGVIRAAGISNADPEQIRLAHEALGDGLVAVQNQFSPAFRSSLPELELCAELGLAFLPWSPLGGMKQARELSERHAAFDRVAEAHGVSPYQVTLAWELALSPTVVPIPGASRPESITDSAKAVHLELSPDEVAELSASGD